MPLASGICFNKIYLITNIPWHLCVKVHNTPDIMCNVGYPDAGSVIHMTSGQDNLWEVSVAHADGLEVMGARPPDGTLKCLLYVHDWRVNTLTISDVIWRQKCGSTMAHIMACCLMAPSHSRTNVNLILLAFIHTLISPKLHNICWRELSLNFEFYWFNASSPGYEISDYQNHQVVL